MYSYYIRIHRSFGLNAARNAAIREGIGVELPEDFNFVAHEDYAQAAHLVLPPSAGITDAWLDQVAGGGCVN